MSSNDQSNTPPAGNNNNNNNNNENNNPAPHEGEEMAVDPPTQKNPFSLSRETQQKERTGLAGSRHLAHKPYFGDVDPIAEAEKRAAQGEHSGRGGHKNRGGNHNRGGHTGRGGHQNPGTGPNTINVEQQVGKKGSQVLGKRDRELDDAGSLAKKRLPLLKEGDYNLVSNQKGHVTGIMPNDPSLAGTNMVVKNPNGPGVMAQADPTTEEGSDLFNTLAMGAYFGSSCGQVLASFSPAEDIGMGDAFERIGAPTNASNSVAASIPLRALQGQKQKQAQAQTQNQNQNQNQGRDRPQKQLEGSKAPGLCALCGSTVHYTGQCPLPSTPHHGDTAVCPRHNSTNKYPIKGHIFDCSKTKAHLTCNLVREAQNGIAIGEARGSEQPAEVTKGHWDFLLQALVVERQHKAPLRVEDWTLDFVEVVLEYSKRYCQFQMPKQVNFRWPYTKAEARKYQSNLREFDTKGPDGMPAAWLDGKTLEEIFAMKERKQIPLQVYAPGDPPATNEEFQPEKTGEADTPAGGDNTTKETPAPDNNKDSEDVEIPDVDATGGPEKSFLDGAVASAEKSSNTPEMDFLAGATASAERASTTPDMSFLAGATASAEKSKEKTIETDEADVMWSDIPKDLQPTIRGICEESGSIIDPTTRKYIKDTMNGTEYTGVTAKQFRQRLYDLAAEKKLPHHTILELKKHWPLRGPA